MYKVIRIENGIEKVLTTDSEYLARQTFRSAEVAVKWHLMENAILLKDNEIIKKVH